MQSLNEQEDFTAQNAEAMKHAHKLTTEQRYMFDYQLYTPISTMYNLFIMMDLGRDKFEPERLVKALEVTIQNHPALLTKFSFDEDGEVVQSYDPALMPELAVEKISEADLDILKDTLVQPFKIINSRMFRCRIFETESALYLFLDFHHTIFDGISIKVFTNTLARAYNGLSVTKDCYYLSLKEREEMAHSDFYEESRKYFEERYDGDDWVTFPPPDHITRENDYGQLQCEIGVDTAELRALEKLHGISGNEFFIVAAALAVSLYADKPNVKLSWIYNGRKKLSMMKIVGLLYRDLPVAFKFDKNQKIRDVLADAREQVKSAIEHSCYPYVERDAQVAENDVAAVLYQHDIRAVGKIGKVEIGEVEIKQNNAASQNILDIEILDGTDGLLLSLEYASSRYEESSMRRFGDLFLRVSKALARGAFEEDAAIGDVCDEVRNV